MVNFNMFISLINKEFPQIFMKTLLILRIFLYNVHPPQSYNLLRILCASCRIKVSVHLLNTQLQGSVFLHR